MSVFTRDVFADPATLLDMLVDQMSHREFVAYVSRPIHTGSMNRFFEDRAEKKPRSPKCRPLRTKRGGRP